MNSRRDYYLVQEFKGTWDSDIDRQWRTIDMAYDLYKAEEAYRDLAISSSGEFDIRLIKAFYCPVNEKEIIREVLRFKNGEGEV